METAFIYKEFKDATTWPDNRKSIKQIWFVNTDKFAFCIFYLLVYN